MTLNLFIDVCSPAAVTFICSTKRHQKGHKCALNVPIETTDGGNVPDTKFSGGLNNVHSILFKI